MATGLREHSTALKDSGAWDEKFFRVFGVRYSCPTGVPGLVEFENQGFLTEAYLNVLKPLDSIPLRVLADFSTASSRGNLLEPARVWVDKHFENGCYKRKGF